MSILYIRNSDGKFIELPTIPGKSAYEIAVEKGVFSGTEEEFAQAQIFENKEILDGITQERIDSWDNGGQIDLSEYATEKYVDDAIKEIDVTDQLKDYATKEYVDKAIEEVDVSEQLTDYALKTEIPTDYLTSIPSEYITETELNEKGYLTEHQDLTEYAKKIDIPTKVSQLENDKNYLTSIPSEYITETELENKGYLTEHQSLTDYAKKSEIPTKVSQLENDKSYLTEHQSLTDYAKKTEIPIKVSQLENDEGYLTEHQDISHLASKTEIPTKVSQLTNDKGYLTEHQDISHLASKTYVDDAIESVDVTEQLKDYAKKEYVDNSIANIPTYDDTELRDLIDGKANEVHEHDQYLTEHQPLDDYATKDELHFHENKEILDNITQMNVDSWNRELVLRYDEETMDLYIGFERFSGTTGVTYVEYIESTGTQYIDTGLFANYNWRYEMVLQNDSFNQYENFFGTNSSNHRVLMSSGNSNIIYCYGADTIYPWTFTNKKITIYADKNRLFIENMLIGESSANPSTTPFNQTLLVFQGRYTGALDKYGIFKCYSFKVWDENDNLILYYKPCLDPSNIPCMYDEVSKTYIYNSGSGQFLYGKKLT